MVGAEVRWVTEWEKKAVRDIQLPGTVTELGAGLSDMDMAHLTRGLLASVKLRGNLTCLLDGSIW